MKPESAWGSAFVISQFCRRRAAPQPSTIGRCLGKPTPLGRPSSTSTGSLKTDRTDSVAGLAVLGADPFLICKNSVGFLKYLSRGLNIPGPSTGFF